MNKPDIGIGVMILSIILTLCLIVFQQYVIRRTSSVAISADYLHYKGDLLMNLSVFAALVLSRYSTWPYFDPAMALVISLSLLYGARQISLESFDVLMDKEIPEPDRKRILEIAAAHPSTVSVHDLRTRSTGERIFIEFHLELDGRQSLSAAHAVTEELERMIYEAFPKSEVLIHQEPAGIADARLDDRIDNRE